MPRPTWGWMLLAALLALGLGWAAWEWLLAPVPGHQPVVLRAAAVSNAAAVRQPVDGSLQAVRAQTPAPAASDAGRELSEVLGPLRPGEAPAMGEVIQRLREAGVRTGLGAFNPPGTKPILVGLAVPDGFELPPGYVRHHQATDDGQAIEPMLRFAPDFQPRDAFGRPVPVPADRVVPREWAPPGLPLRTIVIPPPLEAVSAPSTR